MISKGDDLPIRKGRLAQDFSHDEDDDRLVRKTDRSFTDACNVNNIVRHYAQTGIDPYASRAAQAQFRPASSQSFEEAMRLTAEIQSQFAGLPSHVRQQYANDPVTWLEALEKAEHEPKADPEPSHGPIGEPPTPAASRPPEPENPAPPAPETGAE